MLLLWPLLLLQLLMSEMMSRDDYEHIVRGHPGNGCTYDVPTLHKQHR